MQRLLRRIRFAWLEGEAQEKLLSKAPDWFGRPVSKTSESIAGALAIEAIVAILMS